MTYFDVLIWEVLTAIAVIVVIALFLSANHGLGNLPPGPIRWPIVGNMGQMLTDTPPKVFQRLRQRYGDVFSLQIGKQLYVVLNGYDVIHDALVKQADDFSDRPNMYSLRISSKMQGVLNCNGNLSPDLRGVCFRPLNDLVRLEAFVNNEVRVLIDHLNERSGQPVAIRENLFHSMMNIVCGILTDRTFPPEDERFNSFVKLARQSILLVNKTAVLDMFPCLKRLPGDLFKAKALEENTIKTRQFCQFLIDECKNKTDQGRGVIDIFLQKQEQVKDQQGHPFTDSQLVSTLNSTFVAGTVSPSVAMTWAILHLVHDLELQGKLRQEIIRNVGKIRYPSEKDKEILPMNLSFVHEILRYENVVLFSAPHGAIKEIEFRGYTIPNGAVIFPNLDSATKDPKVFSDPEVFKPDRFLGSNGEFIPHEKEPINFSIGTRQCLGKTTGTSAIFVILTSLIQRLELLAADTKKPPTLKGIDAFTHEPAPFKIRTRKIL